MPATSFAFKQFTVHQDRCAMKVGTDGVMLGAWTHVEGLGRILDVGTGTGLIALMLAQRTDAAVDALEIDLKAADQASQNAMNSPWSDRIRVFCTSFQHFATKSTESYDLVVSNPPYFQQSLKPPDKDRAVARHDTGLCHGDLLHHAAKVLSLRGRLSVIIPSDMSGIFIDKAWLNGLYPLRVTHVCTTASAGPARTMIEFSKERRCEPQVSVLTVMEGETGSYTEAYKKLTAAYYL